MAIKGGLNVEIWPFFSGGIKGSHVTDFELNNDSTLSVTHTLAKGLIQVWGVTIGQLT
jgi:hypothetical protein